MDVADVPDSTPLAFLRREDLGCQQPVVLVKDKQLEGAAGAAAGTAADGEQGGSVHAPGTRTSLAAHARKRGHVAGDGVADQHAVLFDDAWGDLLLPEEDDRGGRRGRPWGRTTLERRRRNGGGAWVAW